MEAGSVSSTLFQEAPGGSVSSKQESKPRKQTLNPENRSSEQERAEGSPYKDEGRWLQADSHAAERRQTRVEQVRSLQRDRRRRWTWRIAWCIWKDWEGVYLIKGTIWGWINGKLTEN